jgi:hypothetical protein
VAVLLLTNSRAKLLISSTELVVASKLAIMSLTSKEFKASQDFRVLLYQLAGELRDGETEGIVAIEHLPAEFQGQGQSAAFKVLLKLENMRRISAGKPQTLEKVFERVDRSDLAKKVKDFSKSQKRGSRRRNKNPTPESREEQLQTLSANMEVTIVQMRLLLEQLKYLNERAQTLGPRNIISEALDDAEQLEKKLFYAKEHLKDDCSPVSDESGSPTSSLRPSTSSLRPSRNPSFELELEQQLAKSSGKLSDGAGK